MGMRDGEETVMKGARLWGHVVQRCEAAVCDARCAMECNGTSGDMCARASCVHVVEQVLCWTAVLARSNTDSEARSARQNQAILSAQIGHLQHMYRRCGNRDDAGRCTKAWPLEAAMKKAWKVCGQ